ncbi:MAG: ankyrin repeat domain-containing protein [Bacteroidia bacterium]
MKATRKIQLLGWKALAVMGLVLGLQGCRSHDTALYDAVEKQEVGNVERLLASGANAKVVPEGGTYFPIEAAALGGNPEIVRMLLAAGAHPDSARGERTPLWSAMTNGHEEAAVLLVDATAKFDGPVEMEMAPFYFAVMHDYTDLVTKMIAHGADVNASGPNGTPLHEAAENGNAPLTRLLIAGGASPNRGNDLGETPVFLAVEHGHWEVAEILARHEADLDIPNRLGNTFLHELAGRNDSVAIRKACALHPDPDVQNMIGETPLHVAAKAGNIQSAAALIDHCNADLNLRDQHDLSPAGLAYREGKTAMVEYLTSRGGRLR